MNEKITGYKEPGYFASKSAGWKIRRLLAAAAIVEIISLTRNDPPMPYFSAVIEKQKVDTCYVTYGVGTLGDLRTHGLFGTDYSGTRKMVLDGDHGSRYVLLDRNKDDIVDKTAPEIPDTMAQAIWKHYKSAMKLEGE
jgi:hypothetical protein